MKYIALAVLGLVQVQAVRLQGGFVSPDFYQSRNFNSESEASAESTLKSLKESEKMYNQKMDDPNKKPKEQPLQAMVGLAHPLYRDDMEAEREQSLNSMHEAEDDIKLHQKQLEEEA